MSRRAGLFCRMAFAIGVTLAVATLITTQAVSARGQPPAAPQPAPTPAPAPAPAAAAPAAAPAPASAAPDPTGATTGTASDVTVKDPKHPTLTEVMDTVGHNKIAINVVWTLITGFLVMFMQAGLALMETGVCRPKNAAHTMSMNFMA